MTERGTLATFSRAWMWSFTALTSLYALLCSIEFAWGNFITPRNYPHWMSLFLRFHAPLALTAAVSACAALSGRRRWAWGALAAAACACAWRPGLTALTLGKAALGVSILVWLPYALWELCAAAGAPAVDWEAMSTPDERLPRAGMGGGLIAGLGFAAGLSPAAGAWSMLVHGALGFGAGMMLDSTRAAPRRKTQAALVFGLLGAAGALLLWSMVFSPLSLPPLEAAGLGLLFSSMAVLALFRQAALRHAIRPARSVFAFAAAPARGLGLRPEADWGRAAAMVALLALPRLLCARLGGADWNFMIATVLCVGFWAAGAVFCYGWLAGERAPKPGTLLPLPAVFLLCWGVPAALARYEPALRFSGVDLRASADDLAQKDPSLLALRRLAAAASAKPELYGFLQRSTNIPRAVPIAPKDIVLSKTPAGALAVKPNIFVFVVDSLRQDYVGAYNPSAGFTPSIDALAKDASVFRKAFTSYGATGLSEPALWAGARLPHKQYVLPFAPMNSLEKLVVSEGYRRYITVDVILGSILAPSTPDVRLDDKTSGNYRLCDTLDELKTKLAARPAGAPVFVYTQPQDIHVSVIQREGAKPVDGRDYGSFYAPYASRVARLDACFGRFLQQLKKNGLYDDSVIVFTADHGDSLGEAGRWGHAYTLFPEVLRVPLIVKIPRRLKKSRAVDEGSPAFLIDVVPTLYSLLGREPAASGGVLGRSLVGGAPAPKTSLLASSYGPVYGLLKEDARWLYLADGVNYQTFLYDLRSDPQGLRNLAGPEADAQYGPLLRAGVEEVNAFYGFTP